jgi:putative ABC transport system permease protein
MGTGFALGLAVTLGALALLARGLRSLLRRRLSAALPYVWRQGLASLHRPANQTTAVVLALGFGVFLLATLIVLERNLLRDLGTETRPDRPNLAFFDIQPDQRPVVDALVGEAGARSWAPIPIVPMRIASLKGRPVSELLGRMGPDGQPDPKAWAWRREYRSSYRDTLGAAETIVAGSHWRPGAFAEAAGDEPIPVSLAEDLGVGPGDEIVWDVQGLELRSRVATLRRIRWARLEPNFFALFPEGPLAAAPQSWVTLARLDDAPARARLESRVVGRLPNVSALDLADVQRSLDGILDRVAWAIRFMALFSGAVGACVLLGAVAASREQRLREAVLLKTLGATRRQVRHIVLAEYACLGALASAAGVVLSLGAGWALLRFVFEAEMSPPLLPLAGFGLGVAALAALLGGAASGEVFRRTALELLRTE